MYIFESEKSKHDRLSDRAWRINSNSLKRWSTYTVEEILKCLFARAKNDTVTICTTSNVTVDLSTWDWFNEFFNDEVCEDWSGVINIDDQKLDFKYNNKIIEILWVEWFKNERAEWWWTAWDPRNDCLDYWWNWWNSAPPSTYWSRSYNPFRN